MKADPTRQAVEAALIKGDLSQLSVEQRVSYFHRVCESVGLNPLTKPFDYITLNGKLVLYANRNCAEQLRQLNRVSIRITERQRIEDVYVVTAQATDKAGRIDESTGAVTVKGMSGEALANAFMKAETKAKRRATLSICGLGLLDETEVSSIPNAVAPKILDTTPTMTTVSAPAQLALPPITTADIAGAEPEPPESFTMTEVDEGEPASTATEIMDLCDELKIVWFSEKARESISKTIGRDVAINTPAYHLSDAEQAMVRDDLLALKAKRTKRKAG